MKNFEEFEADLAKTDPLFLYEHYVNAAVEIVVEKGWSGLGVRGVGERCGVSGAAVQKAVSGPQLRIAVIAHAFVMPIVALRSFAKRPTPPAWQMDEFLELIASEDNCHAAMLMLQVLAAATAARESNGLEWQTFTDYRKRAETAIKDFLEHATTDTSSPFLKPRSILNRYIQTCISLAVPLD